MAIHKTWLVGQVYTGFTLAEICDEFRKNPIDTHDIHAWHHLVNLSNVEKMWCHCKCVYFMNKDRCRTNEEWRALNLAAFIGHDKCVGAMIRAGAIVNEVTPNYGISPVMMAVQKSNVTCLRMLLKAEALVNTWDTKGETALVIAGKKGCHTCLKMLVQAGADVNISGFQGRTALMEKVLMGVVESVKFLIQRGADVNTADDNGIVPLMPAAQKKNYECVDVLIKSRS